MRRIGLVTTLNINIGDEFICEGICLLLRHLLGERVEFVRINKHFPYTVYPAHHPISRLTGWLPRGRYRAFRALSRPLHRVGSTVFDDCDLLVQCGAPVLWQGCSRSDWAEPLWDQVIGRLSKAGMPVLNLGGGASYSWEEQPVRLEPEPDKDFARRMLDYCRLTTVRDTLAQRLFRTVGGNVPHVICPAFLAGGPHVKGESDGEFIAINYMEGGGHFDLGQGIDREQWRSTMRQVVTSLKADHRLLFVCHNADEAAAAEELDASIPRYVPKDPQDYFATLSRAKLGLCNRVHAAVGLAGMGIPVVAVGTDTRLLTVQATGAPCYYVKDADVDSLMSHLQRLLRNRSHERRRLLDLRQAVWQDYLHVMAPFIPRCRKSRRVRIASRSLTPSGRRPVHAPSGRPEE